MARRALVASMASLAIASATTTCPTPTLNAASASLTTTAITVIPSTSFVSDADHNASFAACSGSSRVQITSVSVIEMSSIPVNLNVNVVYKKTGATNEFAVQTLSGATCYVPAPAGMVFDLYAATNPEKIDAAVEISCPTAGASTACTASYEVAAKCVTMNSITCPAITGGTSGTSVATNAKVKLVAANFKDTTTPANAASTTCGPTQRLDITSVQVTETTGGVVKIDTGYQTSGGLSPFVVDTLATGSCYQPTTTALSPALANGNSDNTVPYVEVTCLGTNTASCSIDYLVKAQCVTKSLCPVLTTSPTTFVTKTLGLSDMIDTTTSAAPACDVNSRFDITSVAIVETTGASLTASVKYQKDGVANSLEAKSFSGASCYSAVEADVSFAAKAAANPEKVNPVVTITCPGGGAGCSVKFKVQGKCVTKSTSCTAIATGATNIASLTAGTDQKVLTASFKDAANAANPAPTCTGSQRLDITSVKVIEKNGAVVRVDTGYQTTGGLSPFVVDTLTTGSCYQPLAAATTLTAANANLNSGNTAPYVDITCAASNTASCNIDYLVQAQCVTKSLCPALPTITAVPLLQTIVKTVPLTEVLDTATGVPLANGCTTANTRLDITSLSVIEMNNALITASVKYQNPGASSFLVAKSFTGTSCVNGASTDVSFAANAPMNPTLTVPVVTITCPSTSTDCSIKYKVSGTCVPMNVAVTMPASAIAITNLAASGTKSVPLTDFTLTAGSTAIVAPLVCTDPTKRVDIKSAKVLEVNGANIKIDAGYQSSVSARTSVLAVASGVQYASTSTELQFGAKADTNADQTTPYFEIKCLSATTACSIQYEVVGVCVAKSLCPVLPSTVDTLPIAKTANVNTPTTATVPVTKVLDATTGLPLANGCAAANTRLDIVSATFVEANGNPIMADVSYQRVASGVVTAKTLSVKSSSANAPCFAYTQADVSFASLADANPDKLAPVITLSCPSTTTDCAVKYKVVGQCVPVSTTCSTLPAASFTAHTIAFNDKIVVTGTDITAAAAVALGCTPVTQRVDLISAKIVETSGANINVKVGYQSAVPTKSMVKTVSGVSCYQTSSDAELSFALKAASNPDKVTPSVTIECPSQTVACAVRYEILGKCVATSTACPTSATVANWGSLTPAIGAILPIPSTAFLNTDGSAFTPCVAGTRVDIVSASIVETSGNNININVKYQKTASLPQRTVKTVSDVSCYASTGTELTFAKAAENPDKVDALVTVECLATNAGGCTVRHKIMAQCVAVSSTCAATGIPATSYTLQVPVGTKSDIPLTRILATTNVLTAQDCSASSSQRLDVKSVKIIETGSASINVNVGYQKDATHKVSVKSASDVTCFDTGAEDKLATAVADVNPDKKTPSITVECPATNAGPCNVMYEALGECVTASTACGTILPANTPKPITLGSFVELAAADFVNSTAAALVCNATTSRADIQSVSVFDVTGNLINTIVKYQENTTSLVVVKSIANVSCSEVTTAAALSFASQAAANYKMTNGLVRVECPSTNVADCSIKYNIVASCVPQSAAPTPAPTPAVTTPTPAQTTVAPTPTPTTTKTTDLAASQAATTTMDYYTRAIAMLVSIAAGGVMMYRRH